ncbi:MAG: Na+/H+ antiporter subunit E [Oceanococcaceae bacterium]
MFRTCSFVLTMTAFWLALSGHFTGMLLGLGMLSVTVVTILALRMRIVDEDGHPTELAAGTPLFLLWLAKEITVSAITMIPRILRNEASPVIGRVPIGQLSARGQSTLSNSISLTPGTLTMRVLDQELEIHSIHPDVLADLRDGTMVQRIHDYENTPAAARPAPTPNGMSRA